LGNKSTGEDVFIVEPPCGCVNIFQTDVILSYVEITYTDMEFYKKSYFTSTCTYSLPSYNGCEPSPHQYGEFAYWESETKYPCNDELFDSSTLKIDSDKIPASIKDKFEESFSTGIDVDGNYVLDTSTTNFSE